MIFIFYNLINTILLPLYCIILLFRWFNHKENLVSIKNRFAISPYRKKNKVIWIHGVSVGESLITINIVKHLNNYDSNFQFLVTSNTISSAKILQEKLPENAVYHFLPFDNIFIIKKFLNYWQPVLSIFIEAEFWPCMLNEASKSSRLLLLNARMSDKSFTTWQKIPYLFRLIANKFTAIASQSDIDHNKLLTLGVVSQNLGNIKFASGRLDFSVVKQQEITNQLANHKLVVFASTHINDEIVILPLIKQIKNKGNNIIILIPRHPERTNLIVAKLKEENLSAGLYSANHHLNKEDVYIVDKIGETGLFYSLADIVFIGGSFRFTGHNPIEAACFGKIVIFGPDMSSFEQIANQMVTDKAAIQVQNSQELLDKILYFLEVNNKIVKEQYQNNAYNFTQKYQNILQSYMQLIIKYI